MSGCPDCVQCISGFCGADDSFCENLDGNPCVTATCSDIPFTPPFPNPNPSGCEYTNSVFDVSGVFDLLCYYCDPARIVTIDTCGNGSCNVDDGEDCSTCPEDCEVPGWDGGACPADQTVLDAVCAFAPPPTATTVPFSGPPYNLPNSFLCEDGDVCTSNQCMQGSPNFCQVDPLACSQDNSDLCCPSGCQGPPVPLDCFEADAQGILPLSECDIDCWPPPVCEDGLVQNPETCDDGLPDGDAGINVTDEQCRDAGTPDECTYCGDGFLQTAAGEECEVGLIGSCGAAGVGGECDLTICQCVENLCVTGSGNIWDEIRPACASCSLSQDAISQGWARDYQGLLLLFGFIALGLVWRRRVA